jgi:hypothetical protein
VTPEERRHMLAFAVVGGGPTGVEVAAELRDLLVDATARLPHIKAREPGWGGRERGKHGTSRRLAPHCRAGGSCAALLLAHPCVTRTASPVTRHPSPAACRMT